MTEQEFIALLPEVDREAHVSAIRAYMLQAEWLKYNKEAELSNLLTTMLGSDYDVSTMPVQEVAARMINTLNVSRQNGELNIYNSKLKELGSPTRYEDIIVDIESNRSSMRYLEGCTDSTAINYNPSADTDDGSCTYPSDYGAGNCNCPYTGFNIYDPCYNECATGVYSETDWDNWDGWSFDTGGLGTFFTNLGNSILAIGESIGWDNIFNAVMNSDGNESSSGGGGSGGCDAGKTSCKKDGVSGCYNESECDDDDNEIDWLKVGLIGAGLIAVGVGLYFVFRRK